MRRERGRFDARRAAPPERGAVAERLRGFTSTGHTFSVCIRGRETPQAFQASPPFRRGSCFLPVLPHPGMPFRRGGLPRGFLPPFPCSFFPLLFPGFLFLALLRSAALFCPSFAALIFFKEKSRAFFVHFEGLVRNSYIERGK